MVKSKGGWRFPVVPYRIKGWQGSPLKVIPFKGLGTAGLQALRVCFIPLKEISKEVVNEVVDFLIQVRKEVGEDLAAVFHK